VALGGSIGHAGTLRGNHDGPASWLRCRMDLGPGDVAAASRDALLTLRRVERQQHLIERLHREPSRLTFGQLALELGVTERTIARDVDRLRHSGVPISVVPGRGGGAAIERVADVPPLQLEFPEIAALMASLAALGPTVSGSASSAMAKLAAAIHSNSPQGSAGRRPPCSSA